MIKPRDYQEAAHAATWKYIHEHPGRNPLVVEPTGTGKSLQIAMFLWHLFASYPNSRALCLTHVKELVKANHAELMALWPAAPAGVYSAGLGVKEHRAPITFAGIMSVAKKAPLFKHIDFVLVDEAHSINVTSQTAYNKFLQQLRAVNPNLVVIGYTATPFRMKGGLLTEGDLFDDVCFDLSSGEAFLWLIQQGYLARPVPKDPGFQLNSDSITLLAGDFNNAETSQAMRDQNILERAVDSIIAHGVEQGRRAWLHFCQSIEDAELVADMFTYKGFPHEAVHSRRSDRDAVLEAFQNGELVGVTNKDILTTGYNQQNIDLIGMLRLTRSPGLWVQMVGRGTRCVYASGYDVSTLEGRHNAILASPKQTCLVLDFVGNTERLGPINYPRLPGRRNKKGGGGEMVRPCPQCGTYNHISLKVCEECSFEFPPPERLRETAGESPLVINLRDLPPPVVREPKVVPVHRMLLMRHSGKKGKLDTLRVDYFSGFNRYSDWLGFEHPPGTFPRKKAEQWWHSHGGHGAAPVNIDEVVAAHGYLRRPYWLQVLVGGDYPEVKQYDFVGSRFELPPEAGGPPLEFPPPDPTEPTPVDTRYDDSYYGEIPF